MTDQNPADAPQEPAQAPRTIRDQIAELRVLRNAVRARRAEQNKKLYPNASRGARVVGVPVSSLPPHLRTVEPEGGESDD